MENRYFVEAIKQLVIHLFFYPLFFVIVALSLRSECGQGFVAIRFSLDVCIADLFRVGLQF